MATCSTRFNEARRESPGSPIDRIVRFTLVPIASMRPGANRRDHPGVTLEQAYAASMGFNEARRESPGSPDPMQDATPEAFAHHLASARQQPPPTAKRSH